MASNADSDLPPGVAVALTTEEGVKVYLVGVSHISRNSSRDAVSAIESVQPGVVVLELDQVRYRRLLELAADRNGIYGGSKANFFEVLQAAVGIASTGGFLIGNLYSMGGALCGTFPGQEMYAADEAAKEVGARVMLGDRLSSITLARASQAMWQSTSSNAAAQNSKQKDESAGEILSQPEDVSAGPTSMTLPDDIAPGEESSASGSTNKDDPWGLRKTANKQKERADVSGAIKGFLLEGGCANADVAMTSFTNLMRAAWASKPVDVDDVAAVRTCLRPVLEHYRDVELRGGSDLPKRLLQLMDRAKPDAGVQVEAVKSSNDPLVKERDIILARRLWEAGQQSGDRPVVGVVGARHLKGIVQHWPDAGSWETKALVDEYCHDPTSSGSRAISVITGCVIAGAAYRFPRTAGVLVGAGLTVVAPFVAMSAYFLNRFAGTTARIAEAAKRLDEVQGNDPMSCS